jgi:hypothetical protein
VSLQDVQKRRFAATVAAMGETIQDCAGQSLAAEHLRPLAERQVRGHDQALPLVGRADDVEEQFGSERNNNPAGRKATNALRSRWRAIHSGYRKGVCVYEFLSDVVGRLDKE